jgi:hypothetical protein
VGARPRAPPTLAPTVPPSENNPLRDSERQREARSADRRRIAGLLGYGLAVALVSTVAASWTSPDDWPVLGTREDGFRASLEVLNEGGPPLLARADSPGATRVPGERYAPVGVTDDQGAYLYVPLVAKILGLQDPLDALRVLYLALFALPLILYPLLFYGLFRSPAAAIIAPIGLGVVSVLIAAGSFGHQADIYWVPAWAAFALLPPLLLIDRRRPRGSLALIMCIAVAASFATSVRSNAGLGVALGAALVILARGDWSVRRRGLGIVLLVAAYLSISTVGLSAVREYRNDWVDSSRFSERASLNSHPVWHNAYIGLGYFPNDYDIFYRDDVAINTVKRLDPQAAYLSPEYERMLRDRYFDIVGDDPGFFLLNLGGKLVITAGQAFLWLVLVAAVAPFALVVGSRARMMRRWACLLAPAVALGLVPSIATVPFRPYELGLTGALALCSIILLAWLAAEAEDLISRSPRGRPTLARVRGWRPPPRFRRQARWAATSVLLVITLLFASKPIGRKGDNWQIEHGGIPLSRF